MSHKPLRTTRRTLTVLFAASGVLALPAVATAATPQPDTTFTGKTSQGRTCSPGQKSQCEAALGTESDSRQVAGFTIRWRASCGGGQTFRGSRTVGKRLDVTRRGKVRATDTFTTQVTGGGTARTTAKIAGRFVTRTRFEGTWRAETNITLGSGQKLRCNSRVVDYKLRAQ